MKSCNSKFSKTTRKRLENDSAAPGFSHGAPMDSKHSPLSNSGIFLQGKTAVDNPRFLRGPAQKTRILNGRFPLKENLRFARPGTLGIHSRAVGEFHSRIQILTHSYSFHFIYISSFLIYINTPNSPLLNMCSRNRNEKCPLPPPPTRRGTFLKPLTPKGTAFAGWEYT